MDARLPFVITGTHYKIERVVGGTVGPEGERIRRWLVYECQGDLERQYEEDRPA